MKNAKYAIGVALGMLAGAAQAQSVDVPATEALLKKSGCMKCHSVSAEKDGPSYKSVAAKYKGQADAAAKLEKFVAGHNGGSKPKDQAMNMVAYILSR